MSHAKSLYAVRLGQGSLQIERKQLRLVDHQKRSLSSKWANPIQYYKMTWAAKFGKTNCFEKLFFREKRGPSTSNWANLEFDNGVSSIRKFSVHKEEKNWKPLAVSPSWYRHELKCISILNLKGKTYFSKSKASGLLELTKNRWNKHKNGFLPIFWLITFLIPVRFALQLYINSVLTAFTLSRYSRE